jgi:cytochrome c oxidase assembly protein subunit 15
MSGLKAATAAPTWPDINGHLFPVDQQTSWSDIANNKIMIQLIHRSIAYLLVILVFCWWMMARKISGNRLFDKTKWLPLFLVILQVILGIFTVIRSPYGNSLVWFGLAHQFVAMIFLVSMIWMLFVIKRKNN